MGQFFEYEMTVDSRDVDGWGRCRPSAVLGYLQEAATLDVYKRQARTSLSAIPCPRREGSTKVWSMV